MPLLAACGGRGGPPPSIFGQGGHIPTYGSLDQWKVLLNISWAKKGDLQVGTGIKWTFGRLSVKAHEAALTRWRSLARQFNDIIAIIM